MFSELHLPLARHAIDRDATARSNPDLFDELWANPNTRLIVVHDGLTLMNEGPAANPALRLLEPDEVPSAQLRAYLGKTTDAQGSEPAGTPVVLAVLGDNSASQIEPDSAKWHHLRRTGSGLSDRDSGLVAQALALANWHASHQHCPRCGTPTVIEQGGWVRRCFKDDHQIFPRTDPAIIVNVTDSQDRLLLGAHPDWSENRWSILAGYVEPGESLTAAVEREIFEEAGIRVADPHYLGSQAWPFPYSLMCGFSARIDQEIHQDVDAALKPDGEEISRLRWFTRDELLSEASGLLLPSSTSIARALIEHWLGRQLPEAKAK